jgi:Holliday junction resolvasome RuvABC endonuclease subunit
MARVVGPIGVVFFEEVRAHRGTAAAHWYGGFLAHLTAWCEHRAIAYQGVPVATIKKHATGKGNAGKDDVIAAMKAQGFALAADDEADALALLRRAIHQWLALTLDQEETILDRTQHEAGR